MSTPADKAKNAQMVSEIKKEILSTEKSYNVSLHAFQANFFNPLKKLLDENQELKKKKNLLLRQKIFYPS